MSKRKLLCTRMLAKFRVHAAGRLRLLRTTGEPTESGEEICPFCTFRSYLTMPLFRHLLVELQEIGGANRTAFIACRHPSARLFHEGNETTSKFLNPL